MEVYLKKLGEERDIIFQSYLNDPISGESPVIQARLTHMTIDHHVLKYFMLHVPTLSCLKLCPN
jgi:hypothetical protein